MLFIVEEIDKIFNHNSFIQNDSETLMTLLWHYYGHTDRYQMKSFVRWKFPARNSLANCFSNFLFAGTLFSSTCIEIQKRGTSIVLINMKQVRPWKIILFIIFAACTKYMRT